MTSFQAQPYRLAGAVLPGEMIRWTGEAPRGLRLRAVDIALIPFSLMFFGFALVWESGVWLSHGPLFFCLWGVPFMAAGGYAAIGRFFVDAYLRAHTSYALTDAAAYCVRDGAFAAVRRYAESALDTTTFETGRDGHGTIRFESQPFSSVWDGRGGYQMWQAPTLLSFNDIANARDVWAQLIALRKHR